MKNLWLSIRVLIFLSLLLGFVYPLTITALAQIFFPQQANGNLAHEHGYVVGSTLLGQSFQRPEYFWARPSGVSPNQLSSGGSNLGVTTKVFEKTIAQRRNLLKQTNPDAGEPPADLLFSSASGLDPHISPAAAHYQEMRIAKARHLSLSQVRQLIELNTSSRQLGILGEETVNVLALNMSLDSLVKIHSQEDERK